MSAEPETPAGALTLEEVAVLVDGTCDFIADDEAKRRLAEHIRSDPRLASQVAELEELAREARAPDFGAALAIHQALDALLTAEGRRHPAEILDPDGSAGILYADLAHLARVRERTSGEPGKIRDVRRRLEEALAAERAEDALVERFVGGLLELPPERAVRLIARAAHQVEQQLGQRRRSSSRSRA